MTSALTSTERMKMFPFTFPNQTLHTQVHVSDVNKTGFYNSKNENELTMDVRMTDGRTHC